MKIFIFLNIFTFHLPFSCKQNIQTYISTSQKSKNTSIYSLVKMSNFLELPTSQHDTPIHFMANSTRVSIVPLLVQSYT
jgi:hypothetical protein